MPSAVMADTGTVLAFDFGTRRIGVAIGESLLGVARPLTEIAGEASAPRFAAIAKLVEEWRPQRLVVGLPLAEDGAPQDMTRRAQRFARQLEGRFSLPVTLVDERYTSAEAEAGLRAAGAHKAMREKKGVDAAAAQLILQQYFHEHAA